MIYATVFVIISLVVAALDVMIAIRSHLQKSNLGSGLCRVFVAATAVVITYLISILSWNPFTVSMSSSLYFLSIDVMLNFLLGTVFGLLKASHVKFKGAVLVIARVVLIFELIVYLVNPFHEFAISYTPRDTLLAHFVYDMHPLYYGHLVYTYAMVAVAFVVLFIRMWQVPKEYRRPFEYIVLGISVIVAQNAGFLFIPVNHLWNMMDYSVWGYSICGLLMYWSFFSYSKKGMLVTFKNSVFENIDQAIVLFDYSNYLILHNTKAEKYFPQINLNDSLTLQKFLRLAELDLGQREGEDAFSFQCYRKSFSKDNTGTLVQETEHPLRCDYSSLKNEQNATLGTLLVFADAEFETDLLTGFHEWEYFSKLAQDNPENFDMTRYVLIIDINGLSVMNTTYGRGYGDQKIRELAALMRSCLGNDCYFVRGHDAHLIALISHMEMEEIISCIHAIEEGFDGNFQYATAVNDQTASDVVDTAKRARKGMQAKKLLDKDSIHSALMTSLIQALQECDPDTEAHVQRTQIMGKKLGERLGLSDVEQSDLALLCILHDIGKVGVPLEILNKPGKLTAEEWQIIKSHVEKGYQIAKSTPELSGIADMIRHHHERWDGEGYPDGLSKESIPLLSRLISVVDSYDAMVNERSYKKAMSQTAAIQELRNCSGTQFDPAIVAEFIKLIQEEHSIQANGELEQKAPTELTDNISNIAERAVHKIPFSRYIVDDKMTIVEVDDNFERMTGYTREDVATGNISQITLIPQEERVEYLNELNRQDARKGIAYIEHSIRKKNGSIVYVFCMGRTYYDSSVREMRSEIIVSESSSTYSVKRLAEQEHQLAQKKLRQWEKTYRRDSLTGLLNHAAFQSDVELQLLRCDKKIMFLMIDVDKFKEYNDTYGHLKGDQFLILVAQTLMSTLRKDDLACRMGGDEFSAAVMFQKDISDEDIYARAHQIFDKIALTVKTEKEDSGISMGVAVSTDQINTFNGLYKAADEALYQSKNNGRGRITYYQEG